MSKMGVTEKVASWLSRHRTVAAGVKLVLQSAKAPHSTAAPASSCTHADVVPVGVCHDVDVAP